MLLRRKAHKLSILDVLLAGLITFGIFNFLRWLENWLHQHIFKVGWLVTKNFQTTTILYYTFFLPGVVLYEFVYWLAAGVLNVRAERAIAWPEAQELGELRLNFVKLSRKASVIKVVIISLAPLPMGLAVVWFIAHNILDVNGVLQTMSSGRLEHIADGIGQLTSASDFWLWAYILFAVSNAMMPDFSVLMGWGRWVTGALVLITIPILMLGLGEEVIGTTLTGPVANGLNALSGIFIIIIAFDLLGVAILGTLEAIIERITGDSATFKNGKMVVMTREEAIAERQRQRQKERSGGKKQRKTSPIAQGPPSVYKLAFPIPGAPGDEPITQSQTTILESKSLPATLPESQQRPRQQEPEVVPGEAQKKPEVSTPRINTFGSGDDVDLGDESTDQSAHADELTYEDVEESV